MISKAKIFAVGAASGATLAAAGKYLANKRKPCIPVVRMEGVIAAGQAGGGRRVNMKTHGPALKSAFENENARAVAIVINCRFYLGVTALHCTALHFTTAGNSG